MSWSSVAEGFKQTSALSIWSNNMSQQSTNTKLESYVSPLFLISESQEFLFLSPRITIDGRPNIWLLFKLTRLADKALIIGRHRQRCSGVVDRFRRLFFSILIIHQAQRLALFSVQNFFLFIKRQTILIKRAGANSNFRAALLLCLWLQQQLRVKWWWPRKKQYSVYNHIGKRRAGMRELITNTSQSPLRRPQLRTINKN